MYVIERSRNFESWKKLTKSWKNFKDFKKEFDPTHETQNNGNGVHKTPRFENENYICFLVKSW